MNDINDVLAQEIASKFNELQPSMSFNTKLEFYKLLAALATLEKCQNRCRFLFADIDAGLKSAQDTTYQLKVTPYIIKLSEIYDEDTEKALNEEGIALGKEGSRKENNFLIFQNQKETLKAIEKAVLIDGIATLKKRITKRRNLVEEIVAINNSFPHNNGSIEHILLQDVKLMEKYDNENDSEEKSKICSSILDKYKNINPQLIEELKIAILMENEEIYKATKQIYEVLYDLIPSKQMRHTKFIGGSPSSYISNVLELFRWIVEKKKKGCV